MRWLTFFLFALVVTTACSQTFEQYMQLRQRFGIRQAAGVEALETLVGTRTIEIQGHVKGTFRVGKQEALLLEKSDGETFVVDAQSLPTWVIGNEVQARLIVRASRSDEMASLRAELVGIAPEVKVAAAEEAQRKRDLEAAAKARARANAVATPPMAARSARDWSLPIHEVVPVYASFIRNRNRRLSVAESNRIANGIVNFSLRYGVDARLIMAMVMVESGFNPQATSRAGAMGLGQLMPGTARELGVSNPYDSLENLNGAVRLIRSHLEKYRRKTGEDFRSLVLTLAAYNAGPGAVRRHGGVPPFRETQNYVRKVIALYRQFSGQN